MDASDLSRDRTLDGQARRWRRLVVGPALLIAALAAAGGCRPLATRFEIVDYRDDGPQKYFETFDECYYCRGARGRVDIVARRRAPAGDPDAAPLTQLIHIRRVYAAVPGDTLVERTMINATVDYLIIGPESGAGYGGGGFVTFSENRRGTELTGELESSGLRIQRRVGPAIEIFDRASVTGKFRAQHDKGRVTRLLNEMKRLFGPLPRYQPPPVDPTLR